MYRDHFKLREEPFGLTPDTDYYYNYKSHQEALEVLSVAIDGDEGIIKITGEVGTGKTLVCRKLIKDLSDKYKIFYIPNPILEPVALYQCLAEELGVYIFLNMTMLDMTNKITEALISLRNFGKKFLVFIDEAQAMPRETLEALRLLTNLETEKHKLLQIILFAQPELDTLLASPDFRQIRQRVTFSYQLKSLDRSAVAAYINYRLYVAGYVAGSLFDDAAIDAIYRASRGIPRLVNVLCHKAMMVACGQGLRSVGLSPVVMAIDDTEDASRAPRLKMQGRFSPYHILGFFVVVWIALISLRLLGLI